MISSPLMTSSSNYGKFVTKTKSNYNKSLSSQPRRTQEKIISGIISLKQNYIHQHPFVSCRFDNYGNRLYLVDTKHSLIHINLQDSSFSALKNTTKVSNFTIDGNNSLSLLYVSPKSQLYKISFDQKKPQKIHNLNMSKILAFQRNYLRQMLLVLDYKLLFLYDLTKKKDNSQNKIRSLKAGYNETFTNACFASNNRFIVLAVKNIQIRILEIMNFKMIHQIKLPFEVQDLKIEVSYDSKRIAIYGNCNIVFFIVSSQDTPNQFVYELIQIPFIKSITQLKYTYQNDIVFLGSDQILYGINPDNMDLAVPIFNQEYQLRMMAFDVSLDCNKIAIVSNRNVHQLCFKKGLHQILSDFREYKQIQYRINGFEGYQNAQSNNNSKIKIMGTMNQIKEDVLQQQQNSKQFQYDDEDQSDQQIEYDKQKQESPKIVINAATKQKIQQYPKFVSNTLPINPAVIELKGLQHEKKSEISYIYTHLSSRYRDICLGQNSNIVKLIAKLHQKLKGSYLNCLGILDLVFNGISTEFQKLNHYCYALCPQIISIVQKRFETNFNQFFKDLLVTVCLDYLKQNQWINTINWIISQHENTHYFPVYVIAMLKTIVRIIQYDSNWSQLIQPSTQLQQSLTFQNIYQQLNKILNEKHFGHLFLKQQAKMIKISGYKTDNIPINAINSYHKNIDDQNNLQKLIVRQEQIRNHLSIVQKHRPI